MESKQLIALVLMIPLMVASLLAACLSPRLRDAMFFLLVAGAVIFTERFDVNFFGEYWYRGTTRGVEVSLLDILAIGVLLGSILQPRYPGARMYWPASLGLIAIYASYCGISVAISEPRLFGLFELSKILRGIIVFLAAAYFVRTERELKLLVTALGCVICFEGMLGLKQRYLSDVFRVTGSLMHPNSLSMYLCLAGPVLVAGAHADFPRALRWFCHACVGVAVVLIVLTISRAGIPIFLLVAGGAALGCASWRLTRKKVAVVCVVLLGGGALLYGAWDSLIARYGQATLEQEYLQKGTEGRGVYLRWAKMIVEDHFFGVGLNNWSYWVSKEYGSRLGFTYVDYQDLATSPEKAELAWINFAAPAHSLGALTAGELGVPGLLVFGLVWLRWLQMGAGFLWRRLSDPMHRLGVGIFFGIGGIFLQSLTEWAFRETPIFFTCNVLAGALAGLYRFRKETRAVTAHEAGEPIVEEATDGFAMTQPSGRV